MNHFNTTAQGRAAARAMGEWLSAAPWDLLLHMTYRHPADAQAALRHWRHYADRRLGRRQRRPLAWAACTEPSTDNRHHVHATLALGEEPDAQTGLVRLPLLARWIEEDWRRRHGHARVVPYDRRLQGARYVAKHYGSSETEFDVSRAAKALLSEHRQRVTPTE